MALFNAVKLKVSVHAMIIFGIFQNFAAFLSDMVHSC